LRGITDLAIFARPSGTLYGLVRPCKTSSGLGTFADEEHAGVGAGKVRREAGNNGTIEAGSDASVMYD
jgi:hypothetical protein